MNNLRIESLGVYNPERSLSTADLVAGCQFPLTFPLADFTGIHARDVAATGQYSFDLAAEAIRSCLSHSDWTAESIDLVIGGTCSRMEGPECEFSFEPSVAARVRDYFGFRSAQAFDVSNACAGLWTAVFTAECMLRAGQAKRALVFSGEFITHLAKTAQREIEGNMDSRLPCLTLGDCGAAVLLSLDGVAGDGFESLRLKTLGKFSEYCIAKPTDQAHGGAIMKTDMLKLGAEGVRQATRQGRDVLARAGREMSDVDFIVPHQTSRLNMGEAVRAFNELYGREVCTEDIMVDNLRQRGNTASTSTFLAFFDAMKSGRITDRTRVLFGITGSGITVGGAIYELGDLPSRLREEKRSQSAKHCLPVSGEIELTVNRLHGMRIENFAVNEESGQDTRQLAKEAAMRCLNGSQYAKNEVQLVINASVYRSEYVIEPTAAALLTGDLDINSDGELGQEDSTFAFDLSNGRCGFLQACQVAGAAMQSKAVSTALIVSSDADCLTDPAKKGTFGIIESAAAVLLDDQTEPGEGFGHIAFAHVLGASDQEVALSHQLDGVTYIKRHSSPKRPDSYRGAVVRAVRGCLQAQSWEPSEVDRVLVSGLETADIPGVGAQTGIEMDRFSVCDERYASSIPWSLNQLPNSAKKLLLVEVGSGVTAACAAYQSVRRGALRSASGRTETADPAEVDLALASEVLAELDQLLERELGVSLNLELDSDLLATGRIDSIGVVILTAGIEKKFGISLMDGLAGVRTVRELVALVESRQAARTAGAGQ